MLWMLMFACEAGTAAEPARTWPDNPVELGRVRWNRGYDEALAMARRQNKPLLVLFDEVPGCATVRAYGEGALSHPLVVDAIETLTVPVVVYNNVKGEDRQTLSSFGEPAWNNPVVRIVGPNGDDIVPRLAGDYRPETLLSRIASANEALHLAVPEWLVAAQGPVAGFETELFAMACFWSGEAHFGAHPAVRATRTGFAGGREVVEVTYDPSELTAQQLKQFAGKGRAKLVEGALRPSPKDDRHYLGRTAWIAIPMTDGQAMRVNADLGAQRDPSRWLSPKQRALHGVISRHRDSAAPVDPELSLTEAFDAALALLPRGTRLTP